MAAVAFDTLKLARTLRSDAKMSAEQAEGIAQALAEAMSGSDVATKADIREAELRLEARITTVAAETKADILRWMFGAMAAQTALIVGLGKLLH